jgi:hypothetical protein
MKKLATIVLTVALSAPAFACQDMDKSETKTTTAEKDKADKAKADKDKADKEKDKADKDAKAAKAAKDKTQKPDKVSTK